MKKSMIWLIGLGAVAILYLMGKKSASEQLRINLVNFKLKSNKGFNLPNIFLDFKIINPSDTILSVTSIVGDLFINGNQLSTISNLEKLNIPANQSVIYSVKVETSVLSAIQTLYALWKNKSKLKVEFKGVMNSEGFVIPIENTIYQGA